MRIRKQAKLAGISISNGISSGNYSLSSIGLFCHLSQSPWDVISFPSDSPSSQIGGYDGFTSNGSSGDSLGAVESVASMKISKANGDTNLSDNNGKNAFFRSGERVVSGKTDEKLLKCKNEVVKGCASAAQAAHGAKKVDKSVATTVVVATDRRKKRWVPVSDPEYYYYSGFGPCWGKQRGATEPKDKHYDYIDDYDTDDDDDVDGSGEIGKKRARKPVKARSLKSLM